MEFENVPIFLKNSCSSKGSNKILELKLFGPLNFFFFGFFVFWSLQYQINFHTLQSYRHLPICSCSRSLVKDWNIQSKLKLFLNKNTNKCGTGVFRKVNCLILFPVDWFSIFNSNIMHGLCTWNKSGENVHRFNLFDLLKH